jgi:integrase
VKDGERTPGRRSARVPERERRALERCEVPRLAHEVLRSRGGGRRFPDATPYTMRHSFASLLLPSGAGLPEAAYEMGHSVDVLSSTYAHAIAEFRGGGRIDPEEQVQNARQSLAEAV